jgi:SagB-type dehydrogenase family enzyme
LTFKLPDNLPVDPIQEAADTYHLASRDVSAHQRIKKAYEIHYDPRISDLVRTAPRRYGGHEQAHILDQCLPLSKPFDEVLDERRSRRRFDGSALRAGALATLLRRSVGVRQPGPASQALVYDRIVPNSGNLGSVEVYPVVMNVEGTEPGLYHFDSVSYELVMLKAGHFGEWLRSSVLFQVEFARAAAVLVLVSSVGTLRSKYGARSYRLALLDVGHVSAFLYLVGAALELQVCATAGYADDELDRLVGADGLDVTTMLILAVGPKPTSYDQFIAEAGIAL